MNLNGVEINKTFSYYIFWNVYALSTLVTYVQ